MKKIWKYSLLMAGVLAAAAVAGTLALEPSHGIFYRVSGGKNSMYLLGSIHAGSKEMYPMSNAIRDALKEADVLVFECDTSGPEAAAATAQLMKSETPLSEAVSKDCWHQVEQAAQKLGYEMDSFDHLKPWAVTSTLTMAAAAEQMNAGSRGAASALGVENVVRRQAGQKTMAYLETAEAQLKVMDTFTPSLQEYLLTSACQAVLDPDNVQGTDEDVELWPKWWREGNAEAFAASYTQGLGKEAAPELAEEYHRKLMTERNLDMAEKLMEMLESGEAHRYVVTVGLMHLVLPGDSIVDHLQKNGYTVEQVLP